MVGALTSDDNHNKCDRQEFSCINDNFHAVCSTYGIKWFLGRMHFNGNDETVSPFLIANLIESTSQNVYEWTQNHHSLLQGKKTATNFAFYLIFFTAAVDMLCMCDCVNVISCVKTMFFFSYISFWLCFFPIFFFFASLLISTKWMSLRVVVRKPT